MKEKLIIKNFGSIKFVDLDLGKITMLIGEQATRKSTVAKVLAMCRYFSYIVNYEFDKENENTYSLDGFFFKGLVDWGLLGYFKKNSHLFYENTDYIFDIEDVGVKINVELKPKSIRFKELFKQLQELRDDEFFRKKSIAEPFDLSTWTPNENFFRLNVKKVMNNPLFIPAERGFQSLSVNRDSLVSNSILDALSKTNRIVRTYKGDVAIEPLGLTFKNANERSQIKKDTEDDFYFLHESASGYQSTIPIVLAIKHYSEIKREKTFIIEEPELNLFPSAQKKVMEFFVESLNKNGHSFLIPTHSPYILTTLSNLMYAHKIGTSENGRFQKEVDIIISKESWMDVKNISVYYLNNGEAKDLVDIEECLINLDDLDNVSETINKEFDKLLEIDMALEKEVAE